MSRFYAIWLTNLPLHYYGIDINGPGNPKITLMSLVCLTTFCFITSLAEIPTPFLIIGYAKRIPFDFIESLPLATSVISSS